MRTALFIIIFFLGTIISELKAMPEFLIGILAGIGCMCLVFNYGKIKREK